MALRIWEFKLALDRASPARLGAQIVAALIDDISGGRLAPGTVLPGTRIIAGRLGISRKTVVDAFEELASQGWVVSEPQRGTFVSRAPPTSPAARPTNAVSRLAAHAACRFREPSPDEDHQAPPPGTLVLDDGLPDARLLPVRAIGRAYALALSRSAAANDLRYGDPRGDPSLRASIAAMLTFERGIGCTADHVCITRGSQMAIGLVLRILAGPGDTVVLERLSYGPVRAMVRATGAELACVGLDANGIDLAALDRLCRQRRVRVVYVTPHHQYPTAVAMRPERRARLLALAAEHAFTILEDDYDHEFHFEGRPLLPLIGTDRDGRVAYVGSFSKLLSPSLRLGYLAATPDLIERAAREIMVSDRQGDPVTERAVAALMDDGAVRSHARRALVHYAHRRLEAARLFDEHLASHLAVDLPVGGLALWARYKPPLDPARFRAAATSRGVSLLPTPRYLLEGEETGVRIGFASLDATEFDKAIRRLSRAAADARP